MSRLTTPENIKKILVVHTGGGLGDVLLSTPVLRALKTHWPQAQLHFLARKGTSAAIVNNPDVDQVLTIASTQPSIGELPSWISRIRAEKYDLAIVLWSKTNLAFMLFAAGIPLRVGQDSRLAYSWMYTHRVSLRSEHDDTASHWTEILLDYVRILGLTPSRTAPTFVIPSTATAQADALLEKLPPSTGPLVGFHSSKGETASLERWPAAVFASYVKALYHDLGARLVLTGGPSEVALVNEVCKIAAVPCLNLAGATSLDVLAAVAQRCEVFVCPDSGPMHLAATTGTPTVGIFALDEDFPQRWAPYGEHNVVIRLDTPCCPNKRCIKAQCNDFHCYKRITPDQVVAAVRQALES